MPPLPHNQSVTANKQKDEQKLVEILTEEHQCLVQVTELLKKEHDAIISHDTEQMGHLLDNKLPLLSQLNQLDKQRQQYFQDLTGFPYHDSNFSRYIQEQSSEPVQALWQLVTTQLPECKTQNEINGRIISIKKNNTDQILQILTGQSNNNPQTYSHLGQTSQQKKMALYTSV